MAVLGVQVYVAETGYILSRASVPKHAILTHLAGAPVPDVTAFARVGCPIPPTCCAWFWCAVGLPANTTVRAAPLKAL